jgi:hypothetical protein
MDLYFQQEVQTVRDGKVLTEIRTWNRSVERFERANVISLGLLESLKQNVHGGSSIAASDWECHGSACRDNGLRCASGRRYWNADRYSARVCCYHRDHSDMLNHPLQNDWLRHKATSVSI